VGRILGPVGKGIKRKRQEHTITGLRRIIRRNIQTEMEKWILWGRGFRRTVQPHR